MFAAIWRSAVLSAVIAFAIFTILKIADWVIPHLFKTPLEWWVLPLLFAVSFVPRLISILARPLIGKKTRRKT